MEYCIFAFLNFKLYCAIAIFRCHDKHLQLFVHCIIFNQIDKHLKLGPACESDFTDK